MSDREYLFVQKSWVSDNNNTIVIMKRLVLLYMVIMLGSYLWLNNGML